MEYRTIEGVELATVGMDWPVSAGEGTFTFENLADAVTAANDDPHIRVPRGKLGHQSDLNGELRVVSPFEALGDAEPAFGLYVNLRLANDDAAVVADWVEVPEWLAIAAPSAFPSRSIEAARDVETEGGKRYSMVITAVSCLGARLPAVTDLDDLQRFMVEGPDLNAVAATHTPEEGRMPESTAASIDVGTIRQRFNWEWTVDNDSDLDTYWWWARSVRVDPLEIIADDDEGNLFLIPVSTDGKDEVTFGEPVPVREEFVPVAATATSVVANFRDRKEQKVLASNLERPDKPAPKTAASVQPDNEEDTMDPKQIRESLGLAEDATDEEVLSKAAELREAGEGEPTPDPEGEGEPSGDGGEPEAGGEGDASGEGVAASRGQVVDKDALAQLQEDAKAGREARAAQLEAEDGDLLQACVGKGRIPPSAQASYESQLEKGRTAQLSGADGGELRASTRKFLEELPDNTLPVKEVGVATTEASRLDHERVMASFPGRRNQQAA
jgi:hypothetical protein